MTKTQNYQLNQWESTDKISRGDFNSDNAKLDAALAANAKALSDYKTANDAVVAKKAEQSALEGASTTLQGNITAAEQRITALEEGVALVRLGVTTTTTTNQAVTVDLGNVDMSQYTAILVFVGAPKVNGASSKLYLRVNGESLLTLKVYNSDTGTMMAWMQKAGGNVVGGAFSASDASTTPDSHCGVLTTAWNDLQSVGVGGTSTAGMLCAFYGFKA